MKAIHSLAAFAFLGFAATALAYTGTNLGFETGDFSGWNTLEVPNYTYVESQFVGNTPINPLYGNYFALIVGDGSDLSTIAAFAHVSASEIEDNVQPTGPGESFLYSGSAIQTVVTFNHGDSFGEQVNYQSLNGDRNGDQGFVILHSLNFSSSDVFINANLLAAGWSSLPFSYSGPDGGKFLVTFATFVGGSDENLYPVLAVDGPPKPSSATPGPAAALPLLFGVGRLVLRRRKAK